MMTPIYTQFVSEIETEIKEECISVARKFNIVVNEEGLLQALTNARKFYDEGYRDGKCEATVSAHGHWIHDINNLYGCSECFGRETMSHRKKKRYCPRCGARMDGE